MDPTSTAEYSEDNIIVIKGRFKADAANMYGQFIIIFNGSKRLESYNAVVSTYSDIYRLEPHAEWSQYEETILNMKWRGNLNQNMTAGIMDQFKKMTTEGDDLDTIYHHAFDYNYKELDIALHNIINKVLHDKNLVIETGIQEVSPSEYQNFKREREKPEAPKTPARSAYNDFTLEEGAVMLSVKPIVSPVSGKPIYEIRAGERLMVNLLPNNDRAKYYIESLQLSGEAGIRPVPAQVIDIKAGTQKNEPTEVLVSITKGVYGIFSEEERQLKLKIYNPSTDGPAVRAKDVGKSASAGRPSTISKGVVVMLAIFLFILLIFVMLIIISW